MAKKKSSFSVASAAGRSTGGGFVAESLFIVASIVCGALCLSLL